MASPSTMPDVNPTRRARMNALMNHSVDYSANACW